MEINDAEDLIASKVTRSKKMDLNCINDLELNKGESSARGKRKHPQNQDNEILFEKGFDLDSDSLNSILNQL